MKRHRRRGPNVRAAGALVTATLQAAAGSLSFACNRLRKSAAFCACAAALKIARLSFFKHLQPVGDIGGMILPHFRRQVEIGA